MRPKHKDSRYEYVQGRPTRKQATTRPETISTDLWSCLSEKEKNAAKQIELIEKPKREAARAKRGIYQVEDQDLAEYEQKTQEAQSLNRIPEAPLMPVVHISTICRKMTVTEKELND